MRDRMRIKINELTKIEIKEEEKKRREGQHNCDFKPISESAFFSTQKKVLNNSLSVRSI